MIDMSDDPEPSADWWGRLRSPGGWVAPEGSRPGWYWLPPPAAELDVSGQAWWVRFAVRVPFVGRWARQKAWHLGGYLVHPPDHRYVVHGVPEGEPFPPLDLIPDDPIEKPWGRIGGWKPL